MRVQPAIWRPQRLPRRVGRCLERRVGCAVRWGPLDHRHCPEPECGRPMAATAERCSRCDALLILQAPPAVRFADRGDGRVVLAWRPVPTLADELEAFPQAAGL